jgi:sugar/nucleoside kinase (ribokinase family)
MAKKNRKVLGVGSPMLDVLVNVPDSFLAEIEAQKGGMELVDSAKLEKILSKTNSRQISAPGGSSANTIFGLTELGMDTAFLGKIGNDKQGRFYKERYHEMGGDISRFKVNEKVPTGRCLSLITPDSERTMRTDLGAAATMLLEEISAADFADITHLHAEGYMLFNKDLMIHVLELAKKNSCTVSLDLSSFGVVNASMGILPDILGRYVDIVFANEDEAKAFCGEDDPEKAVKVMSEYSQTVAVKLGKKGCIIKCRRSMAQVNADVVEAVDTTGAGDLWQAGFLFGFLQGRPIELCGKFGSILGSEVVKVIGASIPGDKWCEIRKRIAYLSDIK